MEKEEEQLNPEINDVKSDAEAADASDLPDELEPFKVAANEENKNKDSKRSDVLRYAVIGMCGVTVALLIVLVIITAIWYNDRSKDLAGKEHTVCVKCTDLKGVYEDDSVLDGFHRSDKEGECCGKISQVLERMVDKSTREKYKSDLSNNFFASNIDACNKTDQIPDNPAAKVAGINFMDMKKDGAPMNKLHWNHTGPESFMKSGIKYDKGHLLVERPGLYYIYSQVKSLINETHGLPIIHQVRLLADDKKEHEVILESRKSKCDLVEKVGESTSSVGAVFRLNSNDKICVTTSKPDHLAPCIHGNFFGLYLVADLNQNM